MNHEPPIDPPADNSSIQADASEPGSWEARVLQRIANRLNELAPELDHFGWESETLIRLRQKLAFSGE
jgi:hypothetical protein